MRWEMVRLVRGPRTAPASAQHRIQDHDWVRRAADRRPLFLPAIVNAVQNSSQKHVAVIDPSGRVTGALQSDLPDRLPNGKPAIALRASPPAHRPCGRDNRTGNLAEPGSRAISEPAPGDEGPRLRTALAQSRRRCGSSTRDAARAS